MAFDADRLRDLAAVAKRSIYRVLTASRVRQRLNPGDHPIGNANLHNGPLQRVTAFDLDHGGLQIGYQ
jgi:hypothetical protein